MKEITVHNEEEEASRLSFCDLPTVENNTGFTNQSPDSAQTDPLFEFFVPQPGPAYNDIIFCGKNIHQQKVDQINQYQNRDYSVTTKPQSFNRQSFPDLAENRRFPAATRSAGGLIRAKCPSADLDYHVQTVNISSLTSMSAKSRRRMFMFGPIKFKPEMELCAIKQRQAKLTPAEKAPPGAGGDGKSQWGLIKSSLRGRSHLTSVLAKSLACFPVAGRILTA